ncbi:MAG: hypothetical protein MSS66_04435 [Selenomonadaceae bacterium]|nr:hypothetical protein [Selenomonadaceae bacterium]
MLTDKDKVIRLTDAIVFYLFIYNQVYGQKPEDSSKYFYLEVAETHVQDLLDFMDIELSPYDFHDIKRKDPEILTKVASKLGAKYLKACSCVE